MLTRYLLLAFLTAITSLTMAAAPGNPTCATNIDGKVICAPPGGQAITDRLGQVVTGAGECATDSLGIVKCADTPGGGAAVNMLGEVVTGKGKCLANQFGKVKCANTPGGGAAIDNLGEIKTGPGECIRDAFGKVMCSSLPNGGAALDQYGTAVCSGGCVAGQ